MQIQALESQLTTLQASELQVNQQLSSTATAATDITPLNKQLQQLQNQIQSITQQLAQLEDQKAAQQINRQALAAGQSLPNNPAGVNANGENTSSNGADVLA
jgi:predicted  nucleic acid-binding Zn-ribbon protein